MKRTLSLKRESLAELGTDELVAVAGAAAPPTSPLTDCLDNLPSFGVHTCVDCLTRAC